MCLYFVCFSIKYLQRMVPYLKIWVLSNSLAFFLKIKYDLVYNIYYCSQFEYNNVFIQCFAVFIKHNNVFCLYSVCDVCLTDVFADAALYSANIIHYIYLIFPSLEFSKECKLLKSRSIHFLALKLFNNVVVLLMPNFHFN